MSTRTIPERLSNDAAHLRELRARLARVREDADMAADGAAEAYDRAPSDLAIEVCRLAGAVGDMAAVLEALLPPGAPGSAREVDR